MFLRPFKLFCATLFAVLLSVACGGDPAPAPIAVTVLSGESSATVTWDMAPGVEYWVFAVPTSAAPSQTKTMEQWIGLPGSVTRLNVTSPYVVSGLPNGTSYSFSVNARTSGGPGGPGSTPVTATAQIAGIHWSAGGTIAPSSQLRSVVYGAITTTSIVNSVTTTTTVSPMYVAAGMGGVMYSSADTATWSAINFATSANLNGASYFGSYKLVGDGGLVLTSPDAVTWTARSSGTTNNLYAIASNYTNANVAVGANGTIIASSDGTTWTPATNSGTSSDLYAVTYFNGSWLAVGAGGAMVVSTDALNWHSVASGTTADLRGIAASTQISASLVVTTTYVAVGASGTVLSSNDTINWSSQTLNGAGDLNAIVYGTQYVTVGAGGKIFYSTDGLAWTAATSGTSSDLVALAHGQYLYAAVGAAGTNLLSR